MKFEIELDEINTYKIIVDAPSEKKTSAMLDIRQ